MSLRDPYASVIRSFNRCGVRYVVVGLSGINYYARNASEVFMTLDYDIFVEPLISNVQKAVKGLQSLNFTLGTEKGPLRFEEIKPLVRDRKTLIAVSPDGIKVELLLRISGFQFSEIARDAATFDVGGVPIHVGRLHKLLRSKRVAGRPKDRDFLRRYEHLLEETQGS